MHGFENQCGAVLEQLKHVEDDFVCHAGKAGKAAHDRIKRSQTSQEKCSSLRWESGFKILADIARNKQVKETAAAIVIQKNLRREAARRRVSQLRSERTKLQIAFRRLLTIWKVRKRISFSQHLNLEAVAFHRSRLSLNFLSKWKYQTNVLLLNQDGKSALRIQKQRKRILGKVAEKSLLSWKAYIAQEKKIGNFKKQQQLRNTKDFLCAWRLQKEANRLRRARLVIVFLMCVPLDVHNSTPQQQRARQALIFSHEAAIPKLKSCITSWITFVRESRDSHIKARNHFGKRCVVKLFNQWRKTYQVSTEHAI